MNRNYLILMLTMVGLVMVAMGLTSFRQSFTTQAAVLVVIIEFVVYFVVSMITNPRATVGMAFGTGIVYTLLRWIGAFVGGILATSDAGPDSISALSVCVNPVAVVLQAAMLLAAGPYLLALAIPELVGVSQASVLRGDQHRGSNLPTNTKPANMDMSPTGGFIQVFTFEELSGIMKKSPGLEGFVIYSNEGLVVWKELPLQVQLDTLVAKMSAETAQLGQILQENGLTKVRRLMVESREHYLFATTINQNFGLLMLFSGRSAPEEIFSRIAVLAKSTREFLQWKYPSLAISASAARDKVATDLM